MGVGMTDVAADLATLRDVRKEHTLARTPADWNYEVDGDYVINPDGSRKHGDDCPGCAANVALDRVEAELARLTQERDDALSVTKSGLVTRLTERADAAERALAEIEAKPYRAEEVVARWRGRALAASAPQEPRYVPCACGCGIVSEIAPQEPQP